MESSLERRMSEKKTPHLSVQETEQAEQSGHLSLLTAPWRPEWLKWSKNKCDLSRHDWKWRILVEMEQIFPQNLLEFSLFLQRSTTVESQWIQFGDLGISLKPPFWWKKATILVKEFQWFYFASYHSSKKCVVVFCFWGRFPICVALTGGGSLVPLVLDRLCLSFWIACAPPALTKVVLFSSMLSFASHQVMMKMPDKATAK